MFNLLKKISLAFAIYTGCISAYAQNAGDQLNQIGRCLAINSLYLQDGGDLPTANREYLKTWSKAGQGVIEGQKLLQPCRNRGGSEEQCISQLGDGMQFLMRGFSNGTLQYNQAKRLNDAARIKTFLVACGI